VNGDGQPDLLSGSWTGGIFLFPGEGDGKFGGRVVLVPEIELPEGHRFKQYGYSLLQAGAVAVADWDADGDLDLVVGQIFGKVFLLENEGTKEAPEFGEPRRLVEKCGEQRFRKAGPDVADWDLDGDLDLIVGSESGGIFLFENVGTREEPELDGGRPLLFGGKPFGLGYRPKPTVTDCDGDGLPDLLVGNCEHVLETRSTHGYVFFCRREREKSE
jgi:hypothetical protein